MASSVIKTNGWKYVGESTGIGSQVELPSSWDELCVMFGAIGYWFTFNIPRQNVVGQTRKLLNGYADSAGASYWSCEIGVTETTCRAITFSYSGGPVTNPTVTVYYK